LFDYTFLPWDSSAYGDNCAYTLNGLLFYIVNILFDWFRISSFKAGLLGDNFILSIFFRSDLNYAEYISNYGGIWFWLLSKQSSMCLGSYFETQLAIRSIWWRKFTSLIFLAFSLTFYWGDYMTYLNFYTNTKTNYYNCLWNISICLNIISDSCLLAFYLNSNSNSRILRSGPY